MERALRDIERELRTPTAGQSCNNCVRRRFSYPYTCNDGWPAGDPKWVDRGAKCLNWTDKGDAKVD